MAPRLVSRAREIDLLGEVTQRLSDGTGTCVCIIGEAGIGKSSIIAAWLDAQAVSGIKVRSARAVEADSHRSLAVMHRLLPALCLPVGRDVAEAVLAAVEREAQDGASVFVIDDLHHADPHTLDALPNLCRRAKDLGIALVVATQPEPLTGQLASVIDTIGQIGTCLRPHPLDDTGLRALVTSRLGARCGPDLLTALIATAGNPFLADEYLGCLAEEGSIETVDDVAELNTPYDAPIPGDLSGRLVARAMAGVSGGYDVLRTIAVLPEGASPDEVAELLELPISTVTAICLRAVGAGTLRGGGERLEFRHDLLRRAVAERIPPAIARSIARRAGDLLSLRGGDPARVASCWLAGYDPKQPRHLDRLSELGMGFKDLHPAAAAALLEPVAHYLGPSDDRRRDVALALGWSLLSAGRSSEVNAMLCRLDARPGDDDDLDRLRDAADSLSGGLERVLERLARFDPAELVLARSVVDPATVDSAAHAALLLVAGRRFEEARKLSDWVDASSTVMSPIRRALQGTVRAWLASTTGHFDAGVAYSAEALRWSNHDRVRWLGGAIATVTEAMCVAHLGQIERALDLIRTAEVRLQVPSWGPPLLHAFGTSLCYRSGQWDDALTEHDASLDASGTDVHVTSFYPPQAFASLIASAREGRTAGRMALHGGTDLPLVTDDRVGRHWPL